MPLCFAIFGFILSVQCVEEEGGTDSSKVLEGGIFVVVHLKRGQSSIHLR